MRLSLKSLVLLAAMLCPGAALADAGPKAVIDTFCQQLLTVMKNAETLGYGGRVETLAPAIGTAYDMEAMTQLTLGVGARKLSPEERQRLVDAYTRYSVAVYADQFKGWGGESFVVDDAVPGEGGRSLVKSRIVSRSGKAVSIDYLMHQAANGDWKIVDVLFEGTASQVAVRRSQFVPIFRKDGIDGLIGVLDERTGQMGKK